MGAGDDVARDNQAAVIVNLDADDILFDLDNDATLRELDAAHKELDRRKSAVRREFTAYALVRSANTADTGSAQSGLDAPGPAAAPPPTSSPTAQLDAIATLRQTVSILYRNEVRAYAQALRAAIEQHLAALPSVGDVQVSVVVAATSYIRSAPRPALIPARVDIDQAVADAIAHTPTPGTLPGTLLSRAEAVQTNIENCAARTS